MNFFVDTDIIVDLIQNRKPFNQYADLIFASALAGNIKLFTAAHTILNVHYLNKKFLEENKLRQTIGHILDVIEIIAVDKEILRRGLSSDHKDFEDAVQISCAYKIDNLEAIITRNLKDFSKAEVKVLAPEQVVQLLKKF